MFERFTQDARAVVVGAQDEARLLQHNYIGTEHVLLGLLRGDEGLAVAALRRAGLELDGTRAEIRDSIGVGPGSVGAHIPFTPRAKKVLELALRAALDLQHGAIAPEHLLLGILYEGDGVAAQLIEKRSGNLQGVIDDVRSKLGVAEMPELGRRRRRPRRRFPEEITEQKAPFCPRCNSPLQTSGRYAELLLPEVGGGPARTFLVAYCAVCGVALGPADPGD